jgi:hypothetical protein
MAEYYAVLKKAIGGLDNNQAEARRTVYDKARNALIGQLKAVDPPLTTAEISRQRLELEEAIRKVERESVTNPNPARVPARTGAPPPAPSPARRAPAPMPANQPADDGGPSPQDVFRRAIQEAESRGSAAGSAAGAIERAAVAMRAEANQYGGAAADLRPPRERVIDRGPPPVPARRDEPPAPMRRDEPPAEDYDAHEPPPPEPRLAPEYAQDWDNRRSEAPSVDRRDRPNLPARRKRGYLEEDDREALEREARPSRLPSLLLTVLIIGVIVGGGALAWSKRAMIGQIITALDGSKATTSKLAPPAVADAGAPSKDTDRLLDTDAPPAKAVRSVEPPADNTGGPAPLPAPAVGADPAAAQIDAGAKPAPADTAADEASPASPAAPLIASANDNGDANGVLVAQKAVLYEEPVNSTGDANANAGVTAINAAVTWRYVENGANGPAIEANLQVPERGLKVKLTIHKNADSSLPASHLIEIQIDAPSNMPGKGIKKVPRIVMKPTEEARGQPLVGAEAKITDGFFWIALSAADADISANLALLRERDWIDLPFVYETGQRAILTFEKGTQGDQVFQKAMAAWTSTAG